MKRLTSGILGAIVVTLMLAPPAQASVKWVCQVPDEGRVVFVTAADAAAHGIKTANAKAGQVFKMHFGEVCKVVTA
jgi:hypothetical protein